MSPSAIKRVAMLERIKKDRLLLDVKELSQLTGLSIYTLYSWINQKRIPYVKVGRLVRFDPGKIEKWIKEHTVEERGL